MLEVDAGPKKGESQGSGRGKGGEGDEGGCCVTSGGRLVEMSINFCCVICSVTPSFASP